ncbi:MAG TPA: F0F1 ATP synthase subunit B [Chloroflexota bacterium]|nr:F0F1 ATP synthase subunit B [Chloroflexota bacterium]
MQELFGTIGILLPNIIIQFTSFLIFVWIMYKVLYAPLQQTLQTRRAQIRESLEHAKEMKIQVEEDQAQFEAEVRERQEEAQRVRQETIRRAADVEEKEMHRAREAAEKVRMDAERDAVIIKETALHEAEHEVANLVIEATGKILDRSIDDPEHRRLVDEALEEIRSQTS